MSQFKKKFTAFTAMLAFLSLSSAATFAVGVNDVLDHTGNTSITGDDIKLNVDINSGQNGAVGQVDWKDFSVPGGQQVNFGFSGLSQTIINRVLGGNESQIFGKLTNSCVGGGSCDSFAATSKVILINPAGILFGQGSTVDLNSFTASTFDIKGAKNLKGMSEAELEKYQTGVLNKFSPVAAVNGENRSYGDITFDSNYTEAFEDAGISFKPGETLIRLDGTQFGHFNPDGTMADFNPNKSVAIVSDNIQYKDSLIRTGDNYNYITSSSDKSFSNVRLVTADGVTFGYLANGYADNYEVAEDSKTDVVRNIEIDNSGLADDEVAIKSGDVHIINKSKAEGSDIKISNSIIKGTKLVNKENGDIMIVGSNDVLVDNSRLESVNTSVRKDGVTNSTHGQNGGEIFISADKDLTVKDSLIVSAGAKEGTPNADNAGAVRLYSYGGNANIDNSTVIAKGDAKVIATDKVNINNSLIQARNTEAVNQDKNITISGAKGVEMHNAIADASGNIDIKSAYSNGELSGDIIISSDLDETGKNQSLIAAEGKLSIQGKNTTIDNASLVYDNIKFYEDGTTGINNVTIANNSTFSDTEMVDGNRVVGGDITLEINGDFTLDNATLQRAAYTLKFDRNIDESLADDGSVDAVKYETTIKTADANNINITSTKGNVNSVNKTNVHANNNINLLAKEGNVNINDSTFKADANFTAEATKGSMNVKDNSVIQGGKDVNLIAYDTITFGPQGESNINIDNSVKISSGEDMYITSTGGDINAEKTTMPSLSYGDRLTFNAAGSNNFTSEDSLKSVNVDYIAGKSNNFTTKGDIQFVNSSLESKSNNITTTQEGGDVILNNLTIKKATADAKDTKTTINAKGNVTTKDVTNTVAKHESESVHTFPQSVEVDENGTAKEGQVIDVNQTKLVINTKTSVTTPENNTNGSIIIDVKNANNKDAGIELTAENDRWDGQIDKNQGPEVHVNAVDNELAVSKIITDKLFLDKDDTMIASDVQLTPEQLAGLPEGTPSKGYIEVRDKGGLNLDPNEGYDPLPDGFDYTGNYDSESDVVDDGEGNTITTTTDHKHTIEFDKQGDSDDFILVYDKTKVETQECPELPDVEQTDDNIDSLINQIKLPREQVEISKSSKVSDNTVDQTANIMSAAAKVDISEETNNNANSNKKDDEKE